MREIKAGEIVRELGKQLEPKYGHEASSLCFLLIEEILGMSKNDIILNRSLTIEPQLYNEFNAGIEQLLADVPIQHILGWSDFFGHRFKVNRSTLIPRQETEELVNHVAKFVKTKGYSSVLDIGTGSGCIAISLALESKNLKVSAVDISEAALEIARYNADNLGVNINLIKADIFNYQFDSNYDVIISNPPYVLKSEKKLMRANVLEHDPTMALFVEDGDPLIFYEQIIKLSISQLKKNGLIYFEINERFGAEVAELLKGNNFSKVSIVKDLNGKDRFVFGFKN